MPASKKEKSVADIIAAASRKYNISAGTMDSIAEPVFATSTGNLAIDYIIGVGGIPLGRSVELYGPPSCGKTTTALQAAAELQKIIKAGGDEARGISDSDLILYLDYEHAMDKNYAKSLGLDVNHNSFVFTQPDTMEDGFNWAIELIETGLVRMVIFDSVAAMLPANKADAEVGKSLPAAAAKLLSDAGGKMNPILHRNNCAAIYLNHLVEVMDMGGARRPGMPPRTSTPGGKALKYFSSVRIEYQQIKQNKVEIVDELTNVPEKVTMSTDVRVHVTKNKVGPPFRKATVRVRFGAGFDNFWSALQILVAQKKIMVQTGFLYFHNVEEVGLAPEWMSRATTGNQRPYIRGEKSLFSAAEEHPEWREAVISYARDVLATLKTDEVDREYVEDDSEENLDSSEE